MMPGDNTNISVVTVAMDEGLRSRSAVATPWAPAGSKIIK